MSENPQTVYLVILHDRHTDDEITVHATLEGVKTRIEAIIAKYDAMTYRDYEWTRQSQHVDEWLQVWETEEEGPWIHVEAHEVQA